MRFFLQWDGPNVSRAKSSSYRGRTEYSSINEAILILKSQRNPHRLCMSDGLGIKTLMIWEGHENLFGGFSVLKKKLLVPLGPFMYVPRRLTRQTTIKRTKK